MRAAPAHHLRAPEGAAGPVLTDWARDALSGAEPFRTRPGVTVVQARIGGRSVRFSVANPDDRIQHKHWRGKFYETGELRRIAAHIPEGGVFCDVGANVGNHALFALLYRDAAAAIVFEPNPVAYELLVSNMVLNRVLDRVDTSLLGYGLTDRLDAEPAGLRGPANNIGASRLVPGAGEIPLSTGDALLAGRRVDFLKIDVEGMEMQVLAGLEETITASRPPIFLEVEHVNRAALTAWMAERGYRIAVEGRRFERNQNLLITPDAEASPNATE